jgi:hypothetical protein
MSPAAYCLARRTRRAVFGTKILVPTQREAHFVLDDFLGNTTDLPLLAEALQRHQAERDPARPAVGGQPDVSPGPSRARRV